MLTIKSRLLTDQAIYPLIGGHNIFSALDFQYRKASRRCRKDGIVDLSGLKAWGAYTVGALASEGITKLEIDLAEIGSAPFDFISC